MDKLKEWIEPILQNHSCRIYEIEWLTNQNPPLLRLSIEKEDGTMDLDTCAACSDEISELLDEKDWFKSEYMLEVCSPGAEKVLKTETQLQNELGNYVYCKMKDPKQGMDSVTGDLISIDDHQIVIQYKDKTRTKTIEIDKENISLIRTAVKF